jgi:hypothetical protein
MDLLASMVATGFSDLVVRSIAGRRIQVLMSHRTTILPPASVLTVPTLTI